MGPQLEAAIASLCTALAKLVDKATELLDKDLNS